MAAEIVREKILQYSNDEVPHAATVMIESWEETEKLTRIAATIYVERPGQKAILIGKGGTKLKSIGAAARKEIESLLGTRVYLELHVIVEENWRQSRYFVDSLDWRKQLEDLAQVKPASEETAGVRMKPVKKTARAAQVRPS